MNHGDQRCTIANHSWHLLTAQVRAANGLHREHSNHKQPIWLSSNSIFGLLQHLSAVCFLELSGPFLYLPVKSNKFNCVLWAKCCDRKSREKYAVAEGESTHTHAKKKKPVWGVKAKTRQLLKANCKAIRHWHGWKKRVGVGEGQ